MQEIIEYYNKFNENKRLLSPHGKVEFLTTMKYLKEYIDRFKKENERMPEIIDIGAGTGRYSFALAELGCKTTAVELVERNLEVLRSQKVEASIKRRVKAVQGNATDLSQFKDESFDMALVFGPMYHLFGCEEKKKALLEAKRVIRPGGYIFVAYVMNDYSVITFAFKEHNIKECMEKGMLDDSFKTITTPKDLYDYVRLSDIEKVNEGCGLVREKIIGADGAANYLRPTLKEMDEEEFELFMKYQYSICEREDLMGANAHTVDILKKPNRKYV